MATALPKRRKPLRSGILRDCGRNPPSAPLPYRVRGQPRGYSTAAFYRGPAAYPCFDHLSAARVQDTWGKARIGAVFPIVLAGVGSIAVGRGSARPRLRLLRRPFGSGGRDREQQIFGFADWRAWCKTSASAKDFWDCYHRPVVGDGGLDTACRPSASHTSERTINMPPESGVGGCICAARSPDIEMKKSLAEVP